MKISTHRYKLYPVGAWNASNYPHPAEGALLKVEYLDGRIGYADLHPWPTLGDNSVSAQLQALKEGSFATQVEQTLWMAGRDANFRKLNRNALVSETRIKNHYFLFSGTETTLQELEIARSDGFTTLKIKVGIEPVSEINFINRMAKAFPFRWRLDFNAKQEKKFFDDYMDSIHPEAKKKIEFIEDPYPYNFSAWTETKKNYPIALDREFSKVEWGQIDKNAPFSVVIIKPAVQEPDKIHQLCIKNRLQIVITSYLDHPVGQVHSAWIASEFKKTHPLMVLDCGCLSVKAYGQDEFSRSLKVQGPYMIEASGVGIGFDEILENIKWIPLRG